MLDFLFSTYSTNQIALQLLCWQANLPPPQLPARLPTCLQVWCVNCGLFQTDSILPAYLPVCLYAWHIIRRLSARSPEQFHCCKSVRSKGAEKWKSHLHAGSWCYCYTCDQIKSCTQPVIIGYPKCVSQFPALSYSIFLLLYCYLIIWPLL